MGLLSRFLQGNKNKEKKLKYQLKIRQNDNQLIFHGEFSEEHYKANELWIYSRNSKKELKLIEIAPSCHFVFQLDLQAVHNLIGSNDTDVFDFYLKVSADKDLVKESTLSNLDETAEFLKRIDGGYDIKYFIRFGRFQFSDISGLKKYTLNNNFSYVYITKKGNISLSFNCAPDLPSRSQIEKVKSKRNVFLLEGKIFTSNSVLLNGKILLKGRNSNNEFEIPISFNHLGEETSIKYGLNRYTYEAEIPLHSINSGKILEEDIYDLYLKLNYNEHDDAETIRVGKPTVSAKYFTKELNAFNKENVAVIVPYYTFRRKNLSLEVFSFSYDTFQYMDRLLKWAWLLRPFYRHKNIWLVGERIYKAQDTGFHFFKYMREKHPDKNVFYVMDTTYPEYQNVAPFGNVLTIKSKEHIWNTIMATRIISSHHADYLFPIRTNRFKRAVKATKVFLQHGVMGTKNMVANYGKGAFGFDTDLFLVSSDFERDMIINDFGYDASEVFVTGLSRFDELLDENSIEKRQLLIIPTWRDWIGSNDDFTETEYFVRYHEIIFSKRLHTLAEKYNFEIIFCLHPNMQKYTPYFKDAPVKVISQGEVDVQSLLKESAMMLTDYSSVAFDFSFLHKPIIYYQFDRNRFIGKHPSHLDLDNDLPGDIVFDKDSLLDCVEYYAENDFNAKEENVLRSNKFLKYRDRNANHRIYEVILHHQIKPQKLNKIVENEISMEIFKRFRKSKYYHPSMKFFYNIAKRILRVDQELILFESSVGKQYADSPKYIYEEILKRDLHYKKIWVCNDKNTRFTDSNTKKIKRLSPQYYYYLAKARYWVNNQNFPTHIKKRKQTTYLQTWHGTPLKKMLYDIDNIQGRDESYLQRVSNATRDWDDLISPSPYATRAFKSAFRYEGDVLEYGYPRNDLFYKSNIEEISRMIKNRLNLSSEKKVILYAPTFRDNQKEKNKFVFSLNLDFHQLQEKLGGEYVLLLRLHVIVKNNVHIPDEYKDFVYDVSNYPDIQELYLVSDILMTDYSSVMFDFANTGRPILFYTYDLEDYRDNLRGFYMDFEEEAPGPLLKTTDDIVNSVVNIDELAVLYKNKYDAFKEKYCALEDGHATERVVNKLFKKETS